MKKSRKLDAFDRKQVNGFDFLIGVDEAGRGALAGPVVAAAIWAPAKFFHSEMATALGRRLANVLHLPPQERAPLLAELTQLDLAGEIRIHTSVSEVPEIETLNILGATKLAMQRAIEQIYAPSRFSPSAQPDLFSAPVPTDPAVSSVSCLILIDGLPLRNFPYPHHGVVSGDARSLSLAMAALAARATRDKLMGKLDRRHPGYGFAEHKGYGTESHRDAILRLGKSPEHRTSFLRKLFAQLDANQVALFDPPDLLPKAGSAFQARVGRDFKFDAPRPIGRDDWFIRLDALALDPSIKVASMVGLGGEGKSTVARYWLQLLAKRGWVVGKTDTQTDLRYERILAWSFYDLHADSPIKAAEKFFDSAREFFGPDRDRGTGPAEQGARLAHLLNRIPSLLILDGLEVLQTPPGPRTGQLVDPGLASFFTTLAQSPANLGSFCLVTSRTPIAELGPYAETSAPVLRLEALSEEASIRLLRQAGANAAGNSPFAVKESDLRAASQKLGGHPLALQLLGAHIQHAERGNVQNLLSEIPGNSQFEYTLGNLLQAYERWMSNGGAHGLRQLALLRILCLFDSPLDPRWTLALRNGGVIPDFTEVLENMVDPEPVRTLRWLQEAGLIDGEIAVDPSADPPRSPRISVHPLIRQLFAKELREKSPKAWAEAQRRLYEFFLNRYGNPVPYHPAHESEFHYRAIFHGCAAGLHHAAFAEVLFTRLRREPSFTSDFRSERDLDAVTHFFTQPWAEAHRALETSSHAWLFLEAGRCLRAAGRLKEAAEATAAGLASANHLNNVRDLAQANRQFAELNLASGDCDLALDNAQRGLRLSEQLRDHAPGTVARFTTAHCLSLTGRREDALALFAEANQHHRRNPSLSPELEWIGTYRHTDCLLTVPERFAWQQYLGLPVSHEDSVAALAAADAAMALVLKKIGRKGEHIGPSDFGLADLILIRARLYRLVIEGLTLDFRPAQLDSSVNSVGRLGHPEFTVTALLTRAWVSHLASDAVNATADLARADAHADLTAHRLAQADVRLHRARLHHSQSDLDSAAKVIAEGNYGRRKGELKDAQDSFAAPSALVRADQFEQSARLALAAGELTKAGADLHQAMASHPARMDRLQEEFSFAFIFRPDGAAPQPLPPSDALTWRMQIWRLLSGRNAFALNTTEAVTQPEEATPAAPKPAAPATKPKATSAATPEQKGEALEQAIERLFRTFFKIGEEIPWKIRRQKRGTQDGYDLSIEWSGQCQLATSENLRCHIECKNYQDSIKPADVAEKLLLEPTNPPLIEHWILISPHMDPSNPLNRFLEEQRREKRFPFSVQIWSPETNVAEFFGMEPEVYDEFYPPDTLAPHPATWDEPTRESVRAKWNARLKPQLRLPRGWPEYLREPSHLCSPPEDAAKFAHTYDHHVPMGCRNATGALLENPLQIYVEQWLEQSGKPVLFLLGEFGDGKTCFTYTLARKLAAALAENPTQAWLPLRLTLKKYPGNPREFLRQRLEEFHAEIGGWLELAKAFRRLVILDGFDEMSVRLDPAAVTHNITALLACVKEFEGCKVLITSRTHFFENRQDATRLMARLGHPSILHLAPIDRRHVLQNTERFLTKLIGAEQAQERILRMSQLNDPVGLASKPLFLEMLKDVLSSPDQPKELGVVDLYEHYIEQALQRKVDLLDDPEFRADPAATTENLRRVLGEIAEELQRSGAGHVCLSRYQSKEAKPFAQLLWRLSGGPELDQDARTRIGSRSLLGRVPAKEGEEGWPVDFCHRSLREYFTALRLCDAFASNDEAAGTFLREVPLNHEILHFAIERWRKFGADGVPKRLHAILKESVPQKTPGRMGGYALTLLLRLERSLPRYFDWRGKVFDGADLEEADLSGLNFSDCSFRHANLANTNLDDANFENCDLTGVRIEETRTIAALAAGPSGSEGLALYGDGILREWTLKPGAKLVTTLVASIPPDPETKVGVHPSGQPWAISQGRWTFFERGRAPWAKQGEFPLTTAYQNLRPQSTRLACLRPSETDLVQLTTLALDKLAQTTLREVKPTHHFAELGDDAFLWGDPAVGFRVTRRSDPPKTEPRTLACSGATCLDVYPSGPKQHLVLIGFESGWTQLWRLDFGALAWAPLLLLDIQSHDGPVTAVAFAGEDRLLSGGADRTIILRKLKPAAKPDYSVEGRFLLTVRCRGLRIKGVKGPAEHDLLQGYIAQQAR